MNSENHLFFPPLPPPHQRGRKPGPIISSHGAVKSRRRVPYSANRAPSVENPSNLHEAIKEHAYLRVQLFMTRAKLFEGQAVKTDGTLHDVHFSPGHAHQQQGVSKVKGEHAAHANECAGMKENIKEQWLFDIERTGVITPKKKHNFKQRGLSEVDIQSMEQTLIQGLKIRDSLYKLMPGPGFLDHTQADDLLNATDRLPSEVNLQVDKVLEDRIRSKSAELNEKLAKSQISVKKACEKYVRYAKSILSTYEQELIVERQGLVKVQPKTPEQAKRLGQLVRLIRYVDDEIVGTVMPPQFLF